MKAYPYNGKVMYFVVVESRDTVCCLASEIGHLHGEHVAAAAMFGFVGAVYGVMVEWTVIYWDSA